MTDNTRATIRGSGFARLTSDERFEALRLDTLRLQQEALDGVRNGGKRKRLPLQARPTSRQEGSSNDS